MKKVMMVAVLALGLVLMSMPAFATPLSVFDGWTMLANDDGFRASDGYVNPGWGGQAFDAEYLFYHFNLDKTELSIGLQTGFDILHNPFLSDGTTANLEYTNSGYYAGDLALSFNNCDLATWEYGVDFGITGQHDYDGDSIGAMSSGLYSEIIWNNDVVNNGTYDFTSSAPFAIESGTFVTGLTDNTAALVGTSYYRTVSFVIPDGMDIQNIAAHWTMSCGNDVVEGCAPVPEPQTLLLMGIGLLGLAFAGRKKLGKRS